MDRASDCGSEGCEFDPHRARREEGRVRMKFSMTIENVLRISLGRVRIVANCTSFENSRKKFLHRFESCTLRKEAHCSSSDELASPERILYPPHQNAEQLPALVG